VTAFLELLVKAGLNKYCPLIHGIFRDATPMAFPANPFAFLGMIEVETDFLRQFLGSRETGNLGAFGKVLLQFIRSLMQHESAARRNVKSAGSDLVARAGALPGFAQDRDINGTGLNRESVRLSLDAGSDNAGLQFFIRRFLPLVPPDFQIYLRQELLCPRKNGFLFWRPSSDEGCVAAQGIRCCGDVRKLAMKIGIESVRKKLTPGDTDLVQVGDPKCLGREDVVVMGQTFWDQIAVRVKANIGEEQDSAHSEVALQFFQRFRQESWSLENEKNVGLKRVAFLKDPSVQLSNGKCARHPPDESSQRTPTPFREKQIRINGLNEMAATPQSFRQRTGIASMGLRPEIDNTQRRRDRDGVVHAA
jgi:hypothetical protein